MRKLVKVLRDTNAGKTVFEKLVEQLNEDKAENVIILDQEYTKMVVMYKTDNLNPSKKIDAKKQDELLEESISDEVLQNNGADNDKMNSKENSKKKA